MRRLLSLVVSSAILSVGFLVATAGEARADESTAARPAAAAPSEKPAAPSDDVAELKRISLELNPLGVAIGRYSIQGEYMLARHHALTLSPFFAHASVTSSVGGKDVDLGSLTGFGGANGFFIGPSVLFASYSQSAPSGLPAGATAASDSFTSLGGAVDLGGQVLIGPGVVIGAGFGLQYTKTSKDIDTANLNLASAALAGGGVRPRFLLAVGYSF
jgi:hypothetical protein